MTRAVSGFAVAALLSWLLAGCSHFRQPQPLQGLAQCVLPSQVGILSWQPFSAMGQFQGQSLEVLVYPELQGALGENHLQVVGLSPMGAKVFVSRVDRNSQNTEVELLFRGKPHVGLELVSDYLLAWADVKAVKRCLNAGFTVQEQANSRLLSHHGTPWLQLNYSEDRRQVEFVKTTDPSSHWFLRKL